MHTTQTNQCAAPRWAMDRTASSPKTYPPGPATQSPATHLNQQAHHVKVAAVRCREQRALQVLLLLMHHTRGIHSSATLRQRQDSLLMTAHHRPAGDSVAGSRV